MDMFVAKHEVMSTSRVTCVHCTIALTREDAIHYLNSEPKTPYARVKMDNGWDILGTTPVILAWLAAYDFNIMPDTQGTVVYHVSQVSKSTGAVGCQQIVHCSKMAEWWYLAQHSTGSDTTIFISPLE